MNQLRTWAGGEHTGLCVSCYFMADQVCLDVHMMVLPCPTRLLTVRPSFISTISLLKSGAVQVNVLVIGRPQQR